MTKTANAVHILCVFPDGHFVSGKETDMAKIARKGETYSRACVCTSVPQRLVKIVHVTTAGDGEKVHMTYVMDLSKMSDGEILEHAATNINIQVIRPRLFRTLKAEEVINLDGESINPMDYPAERRSAKSVKDKAGDLLMKLDVDDFVQFMDENFGMDYESAIALFNKKHGIE